VNQKEKQHLELVNYKIDALKEDIEQLQHDMNDANQKTDESLRFIKENLFNPNEGLWAETKKNTQFREDSQKWRGIVGTGFIGLIVKQVYDFFAGA
jgi:two-component SAPR family response regulator